MLMRAGTFSARLFYLSRKNIEKNPIGGKTHLGLGLGFCELGEKKWMSSRNSKHMDMHRRGLRFSAHLFYLSMLHGKIPVACKAN